MALFRPSCRQRGSWLRACLYRTDHTPFVCSGIFVPCATNVPSGTRQYRAHSADFVDFVRPCTNSVPLFPTVACCNHLSSTAHACNVALATCAASRTTSPRWRLNSPRWPRLCRANPFLPFPLSLCGQASYCPCLPTTFFGLFRFPSEGLVAFPPVPWA